jgi:hypothetical protein
MVVAAVAALVAVVVVGVVTVWGFVVLVVAKPIAVVAAEEYVDVTATVNSGVSVVLAARVAALVIAVAAIQGTVVIAAGVNDIVTIVLAAAVTAMVVFVCLFWWLFQWLLHSREL